MNKRLSISAILLLLLSAQAPTASAQAQLYLFGYQAVNLTVEPTPFGGSTAVAENDDTYLYWVNDKGKAKITVSTVSPGQRFSLTVRAENVSEGSSAGTVTLQDGMTDRDLIVNIKSKKSGYARLSYRAEATIDQGTSDDSGSDIHIVTYTVTEQ